MSFCITFVTVIVMKQPISFGILFILILFNFSVRSNAYFLEGYTSWMQPQNQRDDLFCNMTLCKSWSKGVFVDECCLCSNKAEWEFPERASDIGSLQIEYINKKDDNIITESPEVADKKYKMLQHPHGYMNVLPLNICNFPDIVKIDLTENNIGDIEGISCISKLDTLILRKNNITYITNMTFSGLTFLRILDLAENKIVKIEPFTFSRPELGILKMLLPHNQMKTIDMSNMALKKPFCEIDASHNKIESFVNEAGFVLNESISYGEGGMVTLRSNEFRNFPDFTKLGIPDISLLGKLLSFGFDLREAKWTCDSKMVPLLQLGKEIIEKVWRDYMDVKCYCPKRLRGKSIPLMVKENKLDEFTSTMKGEDGCPHFCTCVYHPVSNITTVECTHNMLHMPYEMPEKGHLDIDFSQTSISVLEHRPYVNRIYNIDLNRTKITEIPRNFTADLNSNYFSYIDLSNTDNFVRISTNFKMLDHCSVHFGNKIISCNCESIWIQDWIGATSCKWNSSLTCRTNKGLFPLADLSSSLGCEEENTLYRILSITFSCFLVLISVTIGTVYLYRYELLILLKRHKKPDEINWDRFKFDAYISLNENNIQLQSWIFKQFLPDLRSAGYKIYCPLINALPGCSVDEEVIERLGQSRNVIIFLSDEYLDGLDTFDSIEGIRIKLEWRHAWNLYRKNRDRRMVIINYGHNRTLEVSKGELKAFLRVGHVLDFSNKKHTLLQDVKKLLGLPKRQFLGPGVKKAKFIGKNVDVIQEKEMILFYNILKNGKVNLWNQNVKKI